MKSKTGLLLELRRQIVAEELALGKPKEYAEIVATRELQAHQHLLMKRGVLRLAVQQGRLWNLPTEI